MSTTIHTSMHQLTPSYLLTFLSQSLVQAPFSCCLRAFAYALAWLNALSCTSSSIVIPSAADCPALRALLVNPASTLLHVKQPLHSRFESGSAPVRAPPLTLPPTAAAYCPSTLQPLQEFNSFDKLACGRLWQLLHSSRGKHHLLAINYFSRTKRSQCTIKKGFSQPSWCPI